jgi:hypothetical protein
METYIDDDFEAFSNISNPIEDRNPQVHHSIRKPNKRRKYTKSIKIKITEPYRRKLKQSSVTFGHPHI